MELDKETIRLIKQMVFCETDILRKIKEEVLSCPGNMAERTLIFIQHLQENGLKKSDEYIGGVVEIVVSTWRAFNAARTNLKAQTIDTIADFPAWKLTRFVDSSNPRKDWPARWRAAGDFVGWKGAVKPPGEYPEWSMIALKSSPIWDALGNGVGGFGDTFGLPYPPFAVDSGLAWDDVEDYECKELGLI